MQKFTAIEGLRGWLAWTVVFSHLALISDIYPNGIGLALISAGTYAVLVFVMISGFVITHLVSTHPEPYGTYLLRRFMRIFPLFAVTCVLGYYTTNIEVGVLSRVAWTSSWLPMLRAIVGSTHDFLLAHTLAHLTMLHGAIGNGILPFSPAAFNGPAWSLSLEWQFYLVAPLVIAIVKRRRALVLVALIIAVLEVAYRFNLLGMFFGNPSILPGAAGYFAIGIASRLAYPSLANSVKHPNIIFALLLILAPLGAIPLLMWVLVMTGLTLDRSDINTGAFARFYDLCLASPAAMYLGSRSYSVYLCHLPIISVCHWAWQNAFPASNQLPTFLGVAAITIPFTVFASELLYQLVEKPGIAIGSKLASRLQTTTRPAAVTVPTNSNQHPVTPDPTLSTTVTGVVDVPA